MSLWSYIEDRFNDTYNGAKSVGNWVLDNGYEAGSWLWTDISFPIIEEIFKLIGIEDQNITFIQMSTTRLISDPNSQFLVNVINSAILSRDDFTRTVTLQQRIGPVGALYTLADYSEKKFYFKQPTYNSSLLNIDYTLVTDILDIIVPGNAYTVDYIKYDYPEELSYVLYNLQVEGWNSSDNVININGSNWFYVSYEKRRDATFRITIAKFIVTVDTNITETIIYTEDSIEYTKITIFAERVVTNGTPSETVTTRTYLSHTLTEQAGDGTNDGTSVVSNFVIGDSSIIQYSYKPENIFRIPGVFHYICEYELDSDPGNIRYFVEETPSARYPSLISANILRNYVDTRILPIIPIIRDKVFINTEPDEIKNSVIRALDIIGLDLDSLSTDLSDNEEYIALVEDSFIMYGINIYTQKQSGIASLYKIFEALEINASTNKEIFDFFIVNRAYFHNGPKPNITSYIEESFNFYLIFNYIERTEHSGVIGTAGTYTSSVDLQALVDYGGNVGEIINNSLILRYQNSLNTYIELKIHGLNSFLNLRTTLNTFKTYSMIIGDTNENKIENFNIPLTISVFNELNSHMQTELAYEALILVTFSAETIHLEFYQTTEFADFIGDVLIIYTIFTLGSGGFTAKALYALATKVAIQAALYYALTLALEYISDDYKELRYLLIGSYVIASIYFGNKGAATELLSAETLLKLTLLTVNTVVTEESYQLSLKNDLLRSENAEFDLDAEARQEEIDKAAALLSEPSGLNIIDIQTYIEITANESPDEFYGRTVDTLNPGIAIFYQMDNYADILTTLPKPKQH